MVTLIATLASAGHALGEVAAGTIGRPGAMQANMDATEGAVLAERATFLLLAEKIGKQKAGKLVEAALARGCSSRRWASSRRSLLTRPRCWVTRPSSSTGCWPTSSAVKDLTGRGNSWTGRRKSIP
jgi:adenylosuccinate lyase